jgi:hypothetical protein
MDMMRDMFGRKPTPKAVLKGKKIDEPDALGRAPKAKRVSFADVSGAVTVDALQDKTRQREAALQFKQQQLVAAEERDLDRAIQAEVARAEQAFDTKQLTCLRRIDKALEAAMTADATAQPLRQHGYQEARLDFRGARGDLQRAIETTGETASLGHLLHSSSATTTWLLHSIHWSDSLTTNTCPIDCWLALLHRVLNTRGDMLALVKERARTRGEIGKIAEVILHANVFFMDGKLEVHMSLYVRVHMYLLLCLFNHDV